jgi:DNA-binding transcriptional MerR regulator
MAEIWTLSELVAEVATRIAALPAPRNGQVRAIPDERTVRYYGTIGLLDRPSLMRGRTALYGRKQVAQVVAIKRLQALGRSLSEIQALWPTLDAHTLARMSGVELEVEPQPPARAAFWRREPVPTASIEPSAAAAVGAPAHSRASGPAVVLTAPDEPDEVDEADEVDEPDEPGEPEQVDAAASAGAAGAPRQNVRADLGAAAPAPAGNAPRGAVELRIELAPNVILSLSVVDDAVAISPADVRALRAAAAPLVAELASRRITPHLVGEEP